MTNVEGSTSIVAFHDRPNALDFEPAAERTAESLDYLHARERAERAAAKRARTAKARHVHQELAQCYARKIRQSGWA
jgi:hypothetical protein